MADPQGSLVRQTDIPVSVGHPTVDEEKRWIQQQVVYKNFAGEHPGLDEIAAAFVYNHREQFRSRMAEQMERWAMIWETVNGNPRWGEHEDDVHVPESRKALLSKVARIEEGILEFDPVFEVEGVRGDLPQWKAKAIGSYVYRKMELAKFKQLVQPVAKSGEVCNIMAVKLNWDVQFGQEIQRIHQLKTRKNGAAYYHDERRVREAVVRKGTRYTLVDPFLMLYDIDTGTDEDCSFIGDESDQFLHDLEHQAEIGLLSRKNLNVVRKKIAGSSVQPHDNTLRADMPDQYRQSRSVAMGPLFTQDVRGQHAARRIRCVEMWAWFDFGDGFDGVVDLLGKKLTGTHRVVITVANGITLQFRLNPFDRKMHPYAISRIDVNGHEMVAPSTFDSVIMANEQYDRWFSNVQRNADLSVAPWLAVQGDFPTDSLLELMPGKVIPNCGPVQEIKIGDLAASVPFMQSHFRREHEELSGALRVFESPQGTATETERKVQEQQRMIRASIRANAELWRQVALKTYWMEAQFSTGPERFAVVGKAAQLLGKSMLMTPAILQEDVDFRFLGVSEVHVYGNKAAGMAQWMTRWGPILVQEPRINRMRLMELDFEQSVGRHSLSEVFPNQEPSWAIMSQKEENEMLLAGLEVPVSQHDDDDEHLAQMEDLRRSFEEYPTPIQEGIMDHHRKHVIQGRRKREQQAAEMREAQMKQSLLGTYGGQPGVDKPPEEGGLPAQQKNITPGPPQARTASKTGRQGDGLSQTQVMSA